MLCNKSCSTDNLLEPYARVDNVNPNYPSIVAFNASIVGTPVEFISNGRWELQSHCAWGAFRYASGGRIHYFLDQSHFKSYRLLWKLFTFYWTTECVTKASWYYTKIADNRSFWQTRSDILNIMHALLCIIFKIHVHKCSGIAIST